jgi:hypothetical protein
MILCGSVKGSLHSRTEYTACSSRWVSAKSVSSIALTAHLENYAESRVNWFPKCQNNLVVSKFWELFKAVPYRREKEQFSYIVVKI